MDHMQLDVTGAGFTKDFSLQHWKIHKQLWMLRFEISVYHHRICSHSEVYRIFRDGIVLVFEIAENHICINLDLRLGRFGETAPLARRLGNELME